VSGSLADLTPSIFSSLGLAIANPLEVESSASGRECFLLVDGLGSRQLREYSEETPHLSQLMQTPVELRVGFPSTTVTSLTSIGTGLLPGLHSMLGYTVRVPGSGDPGRLLNPLKWDDRVDPLFWQPELTLFERGVAAGISVHHVASKRYAASGFTEASLRGGTYLAADTHEELVRESAKSLVRSGSFSYVYLNDLDAAGHAHGVGSQQWRDALVSIDRLVGNLCKALPSGARLWVTADHGMTNVGEKIVIENELSLDVTLIGGEPRARHLYVREGSAAEVSQRWREVLAEKAEIFTKEEAVSAGLFGAEVNERSLGRLGDVIAIPRDHAILMDESRVRFEDAMVGHHGALTDEEVYVPLISVTLS